jgi:molybdopterin adenylyltransferase
MKVGRITCSDRASAGVYEDKGGPEIERVFTSIWSEPVEFIAKILPDDVAQIEAALLYLSDEARCPLIITTGGTGFAARDVTPEATKAVLEKELPGFGEIMRSVSFAIAPTSILSRATAGTRGGSLIINLPGNPKAIAQCLPPLLPAIREALRHLSEP